MDENSLSALIICLITDYACIFFQSLNQKVFLLSMFSQIKSIRFYHFYTAIGLNVLAYFVCQSCILGFDIAQELLQPCIDAFGMFGRYYYTCYFCSL